ncbi:sulfite exporter TauE/SafE family protein [Polluticaenibacter yanchengensis]|uniref:Probable membrane transporter protein n=1 Tax=Polluticaenibacter yanchengensis TaxID=3014562 RepID=A0ABT4UMH8_9BACT|nr:sulfite exporter TauE/SafE family protein [Chitinophagaceae bacterium LY-5]
MEVLGYIFAFCIGVVLSLTGGGGSILTVPVLVYIFKVDPVLASVYSLFIVGVNSFLATFPKYKSGYVHLATVWQFGLPSIAAVYVVRQFVVRNIPDSLFYINQTEITKSWVMMLFFSILMLFAGYAMSKQNKIDGKPLKKRNGWGVAIRGLGVGVVTGLVGVGGGFLIIPTLVLFLGFPMKDAVGTSLFIITINSAIGFTADLGHYPLDWHFLLMFTIVGLLGVMAGALLNSKVSPSALKKYFGWMILLMGVYIFINEVLYFF